MRLVILIDENVVVDSMLEHAVSLKHLFSSLLWSSGVQR